MAVQVTNVNNTSEPLALNQSKSSAENTYAVVPCSAEIEVKADKLKEGSHSILLLRL